MNALTLLPHVLRAAHNIAADSGPHGAVTQAIVDAQPGLIELVEAYGEMTRELSVYIDGEYISTPVTQIMEPAAQRIIDAIRTAAPDVYAQAVAQAEGGK